MHCTHCGLWELADGDNLCSWCGTSYLRFAISLDPAELPADDYPPPVHLRVQNCSPVAAITLERIEASQIWVTPLPDQPLPQTIAPGTQQIFPLDVDTFAAGVGTAATLTLSVRYAPEPQTTTLHLHRAEPTPS